MSGEILIKPTKGTLMKNVRVGWFEMDVVTSEDKLIDELSNKMTIVAVYGSKVINRCIVYAVSDGFDLVKEGALLGDIPEYKANYEYDTNGNLKTLAFKKAQSINVNSSLKDPSKCLRRVTFKRHFLTYPEAMEIVCESFTLVKESNLDGEVELILSSEEFDEVDPNKELPAYGLDVLTIGIDVAGIGLAPKPTLNNTNDK